MNSFKIYYDMDNVLCHFTEDKRLLSKDYVDHPIMYEPGFFLNLHPIKEVVDSLKTFFSLEKSLNIEVYILSSPVELSPHCYKEKAEWVLNHLPFMRSRLILTKNKSLLANDNAILIDDQDNHINSFKSAGGYAFKYDYARSHIIAFNNMVKEILHERASKLD